jgi:hypothetical protein
VREALRAKKQKPFGLKSKSPCGAKARYARPALRAGKPMYTILMEPVQKSAQSAADFLMPYLDQFKSGDLDLKTLSSEEFARIVYSLKRGDRVLDYGKNPELYAFKLKIMSFNPAL